MSELFAQAVSASGEESQASPGSRTLFWAVALFALLADQASKAAVLALLHRGVPLPIFPGLFELRLEFNPGAAFSLFIGGRWVFVAVSIAAFLFLPMYLSSLLRAGERHWIYPAGVGLILGGAIGNALDRVFRDKGWVVDFFHAHWGNHSFPVFNVADSCITVGLSALLFAMLFPGCFAAREEE